MYTLYTYIFYYLFLISYLLLDFIMLYLICKIKYFKVYILYNVVL